MSTCCASITVTIVKAVLMATPLWQAMPFVREQRFQRVPAVWFYGATLSAMHFARVLDGALGGKA